MDIAMLLNEAPELMGGLSDLGLSQEKIGDLGGEIGNQLVGGEAFDICDLLAGLNAESFLSKIDAGSIADKVGISPEIAQSAIALIAPKIAEFTGGTEGLGKVAGLAKGLFGRD